MAFFISVIVITVFSINVLGMLSNISTTKKLRKKTINEHINSKNTLLGYLSENQLISLGRIYKKKFKSNEIYKVNGVLYYGSGSSQTRWYDLAINGMRVETIHKPYKAISIRTESGCEFLDDDSFNKNLLCEFDNKKVKIEGIVHKNCIYASKIDDFDIIEELMPIWSLKKTLNSTRLDFWLLGLSVLFYLSLFPAISSPTKGTFIFLTLCTVISISGTIFILYYMTLGYKVKGIYKERRIYYDVQHDCKYVGTIGNVLIDSRFPLVDGNYYKALLTDRDVSRVGLMHVEKLNGHNYDEGNANAPIKLFVFLCIQLLLAFTYHGYSKDSIQEELVPFYNHNIEKFGVQEPSKVIRDSKDLQNIEPNDHLTVHGADYINEGKYFLFFEGELFEKHKSLFSLLNRSCLRGDLQKFINTVNQRVEHMKFNFDINNKENQINQDISNRDLIDYKNICNVSFYKAVRFALCHDCNQRESQPIKGIVTSIDYENKVIHLTNEFDPSNYPNQIARYHIAVVVFLSTIIYFLIGLGGIAMHYEIGRRNKSKDKRWVS